MGLIEKPIVRTLAGFSEKRTCDRACRGCSRPCMTYTVAVERVEHLQDFLRNARKAMPDVDERKVFDLWTGGLPNGLHGLTVSERWYLRGIACLGWLPEAAIGGDDDHEEDVIGAAGDEGGPIETDAVDEVAPYECRYVFDKDRPDDRPQDCFDERPMTTSEMRLKDE